MTSAPSHHTIILYLLRGAVPERADDISRLWGNYGLSIEVAPSGPGLSMNANKQRIQFTQKTIDYFWLWGFSAWKSLEVYGPAINYALKMGCTVDQALAIDEERGPFELAYRQRIGAAQALITASDSDRICWPPDVPRPQARELLIGPEHQTAFDLTGFALAFALLHEFRHVMFLQEKNQPETLPEEEMACDVWARAYMIKNLANYARCSGHSYEEVKGKRAMGVALGAAIVHAMTPGYARWGNSQYPPISERLQALIGAYALPSASNFWIFTACLLVALLRGEGRAVAIPVASHKVLVEELLAFLH